MSVIQDGNEFAVTNGGTIVLSSRPFKLKFEAQNTEAVLLHASTDSACFYKARTKKWDELNSFNSAQTFSEPSKNADRTIFVGENEERGHHCLFATGEEEFIRLDSVIVRENNAWTGYRSVRQISLLQFDAELPCEEMTGRTIFLTYSPGAEKQGYGVRLRFR